LRCRLGFVLVEERLESGVRNAMMAARRWHRLELPVENPLLDGGIADAQETGSFARGEHRSGGHVSVVTAFGPVRSVKA